MPPVSSDASKHGREGNASKHGKEGNAMTFQYFSENLEYHDIYSIYSAHLHFLALEGMCFDLRS